MKTRIKLVLKHLLPDFMNPYKSFDIWEHGSCNNRSARKHKIHGNVQMKLHEKGEYGHKEDYWYNFDKSWWPTFTKTILLILCFAYKVGQAQEKDTLCHYNCGRITAGSSSLVVCNNNLSWLKIGDPVIKVVATFKDVSGNHPVYFYMGRYFIIRLYPNGKTRKQYLSKSLVKTLKR